MKSRRITPAELAWTAQQPVVGAPSIPRLRAALAAEDLHPVELLLWSTDGETLTLWLNRIDGMRGLDRERRLRKMIRIFRAGGFKVGHTEMYVGVIDEIIVSVNSLVAPLETVCTQGAVPVDRSPARQPSDAAIDELFTQYDYAQQAQSTSELADRCPQLPFEDVNEIPPRLRQRHEQFIHAMRLKLRWRTT